MSVVIFITGLGVGGAERFLLKLLPRLDVDVHVVSLLGVNTIGKQLEQAGVRVTYLNSDEKPRPLRSSWKLFSILRLEKPRILLTFLIHADILGRVVGWLARVPKVFCAIRNDYSPITWLWRVDRLTRWMVDLYIPNSPALVSYLTKKIKVSEDRIVVIPNALDVEELQEQVTDHNIREELGISASATLVTCVARLVPEKEQSTLIEATKDLDAHVLLVGEGPMRSKLEGVAHENVHFLGRRDDVPTILSQTDVFVLPSIVEGMSNALLEAMALGCACVVSDIPQNAAVVSNAGKQFRVGNPKALRQAIDEVLAENEVSELMGKDAKMHVQKKFSLGSVVVRYKELLEGSLK